MEALPLPLEARWGMMRRGGTTTPLLPRRSSMRRIITLWTHHRCWISLARPTTTPPPLRRHLRLPLPRPHSSSSRLRTRPPCRTFCSCCRTANGPTRCCTRPRGTGPTGSTTPRPQARVLLLQAQLVLVLVRRPRYPRWSPARTPRRPGCSYRSSTTSYKRRSLSVDCANNAMGRVVRARARLTTTVEARLRRTPRAPPWRRRLRLRLNPHPPRLRLWWMIARYLLPPLPRPRARWKLSPRSL